MGMAPGTVAYTWLGHAGRGALAGETEAIRYGLLALGLLAGIALLPRLIKRLRRADQCPVVSIQNSKNENPTIIPGM
jgi:uncharacterized membrane protein YdjX (TVP38/TMEM64 family)